MLRNRINNTILKYLCFSFLTFVSFSQNSSFAQVNIANQYPTTVSQKDTIVVEVSKNKISAEANEIIVAKKNLELLEQKIERLKKEHVEALALLEASTNAINSKSKVTTKQPIVKHKLDLKKIATSEAEIDLINELNKIANEEGTENVRTNLKAVTTTVLKKNNEPVKISEGNTPSNIVIQKISQEQAERDLYETLRDVAEEQGNENVQTNLKATSIPLNNTTTTLLNSNLNIQNNNTLLIEERIDSSNIMQKKIHRVMLKSMSQEEADLALQNKKEQLSNNLTASLKINSKSTINGRFNGNNDLITAQISNIDTAVDKTTIVSSMTNCPPIIIPKTRGGTLTTLTFNGCDRDYLLFSAQLRDKEFEKHYLFVLRDNMWKPVMNGFAIHKSNKNSISKIIRINPKNSNQLIRSYSVFDIDTNSDTGLTWLVREESVTKMAW